MDVTVICKLRDRRKAQGLSQAELGRRIGMDGSIIGKYERNERLMTIETAARLAIALNCTIDDLYSYKQNQ